MLFLSLTIFTIYFFTSIGEELKVIFIFITINKPVVDTRVSFHLWKFNNLMVLVN